MEPKAKLHDILWNGLQADIYEADECLALLKEIGRNASPINEAKYGFGHLFGRLQQLSTEVAVLAVSRIYDKPKGYPLRSIVSALELLQKSSSALHLEHRRCVIERLVQFGISEITLRDLSDPEITELLAVEYRKHLPTPTYGDLSGLHALKFRRDKKLAHPEVISSEASPICTYEQIESLLTIPKDFITVVGFGYLSIAYRFDDGEYFLTRDAEGIARPLIRLLQRAKIIDDKGTPGM